MHIVGFLVNSLFFVDCRFLEGYLWFFLTVKTDKLLNYMKYMNKFNLKIYEFQAKRQALRIYFFVKNLIVGFS